MALTALLVILMLGVEIYRPMRELRTVLHQGMVGMSAAQGIYQILDDRPDRRRCAAGRRSTRPLAPAIAFEGVRFPYPGTRRTVHERARLPRSTPGERIGLVGSSGGGKSSIVRLLLRFYDPEQGRITLGGHDLRSLSFAADPLADLGGEPGHLPVPRHGRGEHPPGPARGVDARGRGGGARGQYPRFHLRACRRAIARSSARRASSSPAASASASPSPARCCATRRSWCSTRRCRPSMPRTRR